MDVIELDVANELLTPNRFSCIDAKDGSLRIGAAPRLALAIGYDVEDVVG